MKIRMIYTGAPATPEELLDAKKAQEQRICELLEYGRTICESPESGQDTHKTPKSGQGICPADGGSEFSLLRFSINTAGALKKFPLLISAFEEGLAGIRSLLSPEQILFFEESRKHTGPLAFFLVRQDSRTLKTRLVAVEESHPLGRLFNMDILTSDGHSVSRSELGLPERTCIICGESAGRCIQSQAHSTELLQWRTAQMLNDYFRARSADQIAACAVRSLLYEVSSTPKPGLVDRNNSGSHRDMNFFTFLDSSAALIPWFRDFYCIGWDYADDSAPELFSRLRFAGRQAETHMFSATGGINTHKGLVFAFAILCGALGKLHAGQEHSITRRSLLSVSQKLGACALTDFDKMKFSAAGYPMTAGERFHSSYGITGARGEAASGFPSALKLGLPALKKWLSLGFTLNDAAALSILSLLAQVDDTNMIHRGGKEEADARKKEAQRLLNEITPENFKEKLTALDLSYIQGNLSPGGCADLLAVSLIFYFLEINGILV